MNFNFQYDPNLLAQISQGLPFDKWAEANLRGREFKNNELRAQVELALRRLQIKETERDIEEKEEDRPLRRRSLEAETKQKETSALTSETELNEFQKSSKLRELERTRGELSTQQDIKNAELAGRARRVQLQEQIDSSASKKNTDMQGAIAAVAPQISDQVSYDQARQMLQKQFGRDVFRDYGLPKEFNPSTMEQLTLLRDSAIASVQHQQALELARSKGRSRGDLQDSMPDKPYTYPTLAQMQEDAVATGIQMGLFEEGDDAAQAFGRDVARTAQSIVNQSILQYNASGKTQPPLTYDEAFEVAIQQNAEGIGEKTSEGMMGRLFGSKEKTYMPKPMRESIDEAKRQWKMEINRRLSTSPEFANLSPEDKDQLLEEMWNDPEINQNVR